MTRYMLLMPKMRGRPILSFTWDDQAGVVTGRDAALVMERVDMALQSGTVEIHPAPDIHTVSDAPLRSMTDMAAILGYDYHLPDWLADAYPEGEGHGDDLDHLPGVTF